MSLKRTLPRFPVLLVVAALVMLAGLVGLLAVVLQSSAELADTDRLIVDDTEPSIVALQLATVRLGELHALARERLLGSTRDRALLDEEIATKRAQLREALAAYYALPLDPGEAHVNATIHESHDGLERVLHRALGAGGPASAPEIVTALDSSVARLDGALLGAVSLDTDLEQRALAQLRSLRRVLLPGAAAFEGLCTLATVAMLWFAYRWVRAATESAATNRRLLETRTIELEAFTGRVAHDLLSPLMAVGMALAAAESTLDPPERDAVRRMVVRAEGSLSRVQRLVADLLDFARSGAKPRADAEADVARVMTGVAEDFRSLAEAARADLRVEIATARRVRCAEGVLHSVIANLVQNALKFLDRAPERRVVMRAVDAGKDVRVEVQDTGPGVPAEEHVLIFEPYVRRRDEAPGLGLGLATVKRLAEAHGGGVGLVSKPGEGALFWVTLPAVL
jgi:signal transduction histidine kinase